MKMEKKLSRRDYLALTGAAASAAIMAPKSLWADPNPSPKNKAKIKFSMYLYTLMDCPWPMKEMDIA